jgi:hypothetical protein
MKWAERKFQLLTERGTKEEERGKKTNGGKSDGNEVVRKGKDGT